MSEPTLFQEIYSNYYRTAAKVLSYACTHGGIGSKELERLIKSSLIDANEQRGGRWLEYIAHLTGDYALLFGDEQAERYRTPIQSPPPAVQTLAERQWLCAVLRDPRVRLFLDEPIETPDGVEPLFDADMFVWYDRYSDGDPFTDPGYIERFRTVRTALRERRMLRVDYTDGLGRTAVRTVVPHVLEYSEKDDKFRLITADAPQPQILNLSRMRACSLGAAVPEPELAPSHQNELELLVTGKKSALKDVETEFKDHDLSIEEIGKKQFRVKITYRDVDEPDILFRLLYPLTENGEVRLTGPAPLVLRMQALVPMEMTVTDRNNALERVLLHFSDLHKTAERLDDEGKRYRVRMVYRADDEIEILIRVLSFGSVIRVTEPKRLVDLICERLRLQLLKYDGQ